MKTKIAKLVLLISLLYFTAAIAQSPVISSFSPSKGPSGTLVRIKGSNLSNPTAFIGGKPALIISHSTDSIIAYVMPGVTTGLISVNTSVGSANSSATFSLTPTPFPAAQQGPKLLVSGNEGNAGAGRSVAISADGNTAIVGGPNDNFQQGAAWIYTRNGGVWKQEGPKLVGNDHSGPANQGRSVAISADGNTVIIGGNRDDSGMGAVWVFIREKNTWYQQGPKLVGNGSDGSFLPVNQGYSVGLSGDGNTVIVGGPYDSFNRGAAWIFSRKDNRWTQEGDKLFDNSSTGSQGQGLAVGLSADGNTAIVGAPLDNAQEGAAFVFLRNGSAWNQLPKRLFVSNGSGPKWQGISVALSADGYTAIIGGSVARQAQGSARVFSRNGTEWTQRGLDLVGSGNSINSSQGWSVSISADGNTALVGGYQDNWTNGASWVYNWSNSGWVQKGPKLTGVGNTGKAQQGQSLALSSDGSTAIIGGNTDDDNKGASWIFTTGPAISINLKSFTSTFCQGVTRTSFYYAEKEGNPNQYSIIWDEMGLKAGLTNVFDQTLPADSIVVTMPSTLPDGIYNGALKVRNSFSGESSTGIIFTLTIPEPPKISPITGAGSVSVGSSISLNTATAGGTWSGSSNLIATVNSVTGEVTGISEGTVIISYTLTNSEGCTNTANYNLLVFSQSSLAQIIFSALPLKTYGDAEFSPGAVFVNSASTIVYSSSDTRVAVIGSSGQIKITGAGSAVITASQDTNSAIKASQLLTIKPKGLIIKANDQSRAYGTANPQLLADYSGFVNGEDASIFKIKPQIITTASIFSSPGTYPIVVNGAEAPNYSISYQDGKLLISKADQIIVFDTIPNKTIKESGFILHVLVNSGLPVTFSSSDPSVAAIINSSQVKINKAGKVIITATQAGNENYKPITAFREFTIFLEDLTIKVNTFSPNGDGINDQWLIRGLESDKTVLIEIYNRYGKLVYHRKGYIMPWDGQYLGEKLPQGAYYYKVSAMSGEQVLSGSVSIIY